jgi:hypothetical protein
VYRQTGPSKGNRRAPVAAPGSKGASRPTPQRGGGGNKAAGSSEPTTVTSTVATVSPAGAVSGVNRAAARRAAASRRRVTRVKRQVNAEEHRVAAAALASVAAGRSKRAAERSSAPKPSSFLGRKTAGAPTKAELLAARKTGTLQVNDAGAVTTPAIRQASHHLAKAAAALAAEGSTGQLHSAIVTTPEQAKVTRQILKIGERSHADRKEKLAALTTGLQESGLKNLPISGPGGGWRQEELAFYPPSTITNVKKGAKNYFEEARAAGRGRGETPAELSQAVQNSGAGESYYEDNQSEARQLLKQYNRGKGSPKARRQVAVAKKQAAALGLHPEATAKVGPPPKEVVTRYKVADKAMREVNARGFDYSWGGGHNSTFAPVGEEGEGYDCSGAVSYVLHKTIGLKAPLTSGDMGSVLQPGPGALTVFYNGEHTFMYDAVKGEYWGTSESNPGGGAGWFPKSVGDSEVASGNSSGAYSVGHIPGLGRKQAIQLGGSLPSASGTSASASASSSPFPGMTLSPSETTARINKGAGAKKGKPGFSKRPIKLTTAQRYARNKRKLAEVGAPLSSSSKSGRSESHPILEELKAKYGTASTSAKQSAAEAAAA